MIHTCKPLAAVVALLLTSGHAFATATASATLANLTVTVGRISNLAGTAAPSATFQIQDNGSHALTYEVSDNPASCQSVSGAGTTFLGGLDFPSSGPLANASATLTGDAGSGSAVATASAWASGSSVPGAASSGSASRVSLGDGSDTLNFTLGANTFLEISGQLTLATGLSAPTENNAFETATAFGYFSLTGTDGINTQSSIASVTQTVQNFFGGFSDAGTQGTFVMDISFVGSRFAQTTGVFDGVVAANVSTNVSSVPESANLSLMLVGLASLGLLARARRAR